MDYLPLFHDLTHQPCLIVGGGEIATRKVHSLLEAHAPITVLSPTLTESLTELANQGKITHWQKTFEADDLSHFNLVISATDDAALNALVSETAMARKIPVNVVDNPKLCSFIFPAIVDRSPVTIAISTGGRSPVLARFTRARLETLLPARLGQLAQLAAEYRDRVKQTFSDPRKRRMFWESALDGAISDKVYRGDLEGARQDLDARLAEDHSNTVKGQVYLVGGGPGDPELITLKALRLMQQADVVVYDHLVSDEVLNLVRRDAERIYAGKQRQQHTLTQESINELLIRLAQEGKRVLRLKGGDPFIFGRGGEEIETLISQNIPFEVVPGITAASGCASYAGIPLTHRDYAQSCVFVTGHLKNNTINLDWENLVKPNQTLVVYMGLVGLEQICNQLIQHGLTSDTPAALIQQGTRPTQQVIASTLALLPELVEKAQPKPPTLLIIGGVVKLHPTLNWFTP